VLRFAPMRTSRLTFLFTPAQEPLQISGIAIPGVPALTTPSGPFRLRCGLGPDIELNGKAVPTQVSGTFADLLTGRPMPFTACSRVTIARGTNRIVEPVHDGFDVQDAVLVRNGGLGPTAAPATGLAASAVVRSWTPSRRIVQVTAPARAYLVVNENFNAGWQASLGGTRLRPARIDGWKQAWLLPAGTAGTVTLTYAPNRLYRDALAGGLGTLALVLLVALWPARRKTRERIRRPRWLTLPERSREAGASQLPGWLRRPVRVRPGWGAAKVPLTKSRGPFGHRGVPGGRSPGQAPLTWAVTGCGLLLAGLWLGGYPGAVILAATAGLFTAAVSRRHKHRVWLELCRPWLVAALLLAAAGCAVVGERLLAEGASGPLVTALTSTAPQVICLVIVARLAAALFVGDPQ
jgi:arabinofuranan 3-O-arabinosyltransferase